MKTDLSKVFEDCLARMRQGEAIEACLSRYPSVRQQLEPLLRTALSISNAPKVVPSDEFRRESRARLMSRIRESSVQVQSKKSGKVKAEYGRPGWGWGALADALVLPGRVSVPVTSALFLALAAILIVYSVFSFLPQQSGHSMLASKCTLSILTGSVEVQLPDSDTWYIAEDGMTLESGSRVKTPPDSNALLTFFEGSTIKLEPDTDVEVEKVESIGEQGSEIVLKQWLGKTWNRVVKKADPGSRYEIHTPSAYALVRGTLFEVEVDQTGATAVRTAEGLVSVSAQGEEVYVPAGQETNVEPGALPSQPLPIPVADNELVVTVGMPAVAAICDPGLSSTGYLPSGVAFNQILGSQSSSPVEGDQIIRISRPMAGYYYIILRCVADGTGSVDIVGLSEGNTVFKESSSYEVTEGSEWLIEFSLQFEDGRLRGARVSDIEPLGGKDYGKIVITELEGAVAVPIKPVEDPGQSDENKVTAILTVISSTGGVVAAPGEGEFIYKSGAVVELISEPDQGYEFVGWTGDVDNPLSCTTSVTVDQDQIVAARFAKRIHVLSIISNGNGTVTEPGESISLHGTGAVVTLVAEPGVGWEFDSWTGNVADPSSSVTTITMTHPEVVAANFVPRN